MFQTSYDLQCGQGFSTAWIPCIMENCNSKRVTHIMQHEGFWFQNGNSNSTVPQIPCEMKGSSFQSYEYHAKTTITKSEMLQYAKKRFQLAANKLPKITSGIGVCLLWKPCWRCLNILDTSWITLISCRKSFKYFVSRAFAAVKIWPATQNAKQIKHTLFGSNVAFKTLFWFLKWITHSTKTNTHGLN